MELGFSMDKLTPMSPVSLIIAIAAVVGAVIYFAVSSTGLPPGPIGLPFVGYWPFLNSKTCHLQLDALKKKYGDIFCFRSSGRLYINLGTAKAIREVQVTKADCFGSRVVDYSYLSHSFQDGVAFAYGEPWKALRKYFLQVVKDRGVTSVKGSLSGPLYDSMNATVDHLLTKNGEPENMLLLLMDKCTAIWRQTLFGDTGVTKEQLKEITEYYGVFSESMTSSNLLLSGTFAKIMFTIMPATRNSLRNFKRAEKALYKIIDDHKSSYNEEQPRDVIDDFIKERNLRRSKGDPTAQYFTDKALMASLVQFLGDGVFTVAASLSLFLKRIADNPEEQEKIYQELVEVVGIDRQPAIEDKNKLTYTNAFILEVLRTSDLFPFFPTLECSKETTVRGFRIPVGAIILMNIYSAHCDPEVYQSPEKFNPSRFISKEGGKRAELPVSFGMGRRACLGEGFVMIQIFLFLTTLIKNFRLTLAKEPDDIFADIVQGKLEMCAHPRRPAI